MPRFSSTSKRQLLTCEEPLQRVFFEVIKRRDCTILEGFRNQARQDEFFRAGKSQKPWPEGKHNTLPSRAVDAAPYPIDWEDRERFYHFAGYVLGVGDMLGIPLRWGGDWDGDQDLRDQDFFDLVHFEIFGKAGESKKKENGIEDRGIPRLTHYGRGDGKGGMKNWCGVPFRPKQWVDVWEKVTCKKCLAKREYLRRNPPDRGDVEPIRYDRAPLPF